VCIHSSDGIFFEGKRSGFRGREKTNQFTHKDIKIGKQVKQVKGRITEWSLLIVLIGYLDSLMSDGTIS